MLTVGHQNEYVVTYNYLMNDFSVLKISYRLLMTPKYLKYLELINNLLRLCDGLK